VPIAVVTLNETRVVFWQGATCSATAPAIAESNMW
jgi:hypothetical protein